MNSDARAAKDKAADSAGSLRGSSDAARASTGRRLAELYDRHGPQTYRYLLVLLGNAAEAEDALQAVFVELARKPEILDRLESPTAYLIAAARNKALRERRRAARRSQAEGESVGPQVFQVRDGSRHEPAEVERIERAVMSLPEDQRQVLTLKLYEEMTFAEIGEALGISPNTAAGRYRYALEKLRRVIAP